MSIAYQISVQGPLLLATASGVDDSFEEVQRYGAAVLEAALANKCTLVICDERDLIYKTDTVDLYVLARSLAENAPKMARVALVCKAEQFKDASFWQVVATNRGLTVRAFKEMEAAQAWIEGKPVP